MSMERADLFWSISAKTNVDTKDWAFSLHDLKSDFP